MIRPQRNRYRRAIDLSGIWTIRFDPDDRGVEDRWFADRNWPDTHAIAVPGSWNEQCAEAGWMNHVGPAWYRIAVFVPAGSAGSRHVLRFASADYFADVWIDGVHTGKSGAPFLPFEIDIGDATDDDRTIDLVVRVTNLLPVDGPTQRVGLDDYRAEGRIRDEYLPAVRFDFFPYGGINRPVHLTTVPARGFSTVRIDTAIDGTTGNVDVMATFAGDGSIVASIAGAGRAEGAGSLRLSIADCRFWSPDDPMLYPLTLTLHDGNGGAIDQVDMLVGVREVRVDGTALLLNGTPITLRGFGKHEDSPVRGRGLDLPLMVKDFGLLKWIGANSVRTAHYPYAEEFLDMADREGILVIDEAFSINLDFRRTGPATLAAHKDELSQLIARDRNHPCVIAWSLANEPGYLAEPEYREKSGSYWAELFGHTRALDSSRPLTHANVGFAGNDDPGFAEADFISINRYHGWYGAPGQIERAAALLTADLDAIAAYGKPIFISEFGADAVAGAHATHDQLFTEEYQADLIAAYLRVVAAHPACVGAHVWNFADFRTAQHSRRVILNLKGVFTRTREPKRAAWMLRDLWRGA